MPATSAPIDLTAHLLIAMPDMDDPRFAGSVVFLCAHSDDGAMGLVVNKPLPDIGLADMLAQLDIDASDPLPSLPVCNGGPVEQGRGLVLHDARYRGRENDAMDIDDRFTLTATVGVMEDLAAGRGPADALIALGHAAWAGGQLEAEIRANGWLTCPAAPDLVFGTPMPDKWDAALASLGVHPLTLSVAAGRA